MRFRLETHDDDGNEQVRLYLQGPNGEAILAGIFSPDGTRLDDQRIGEVKELYRIAMLPEPVTVSRPKEWTINDWWWFAISLVVGGAVISAPYFIR